MLRTRRQATLRHAGNACDAVARDELGVLAVRADTDVGTVAIGQHVQARAEVEIDAEAAQLARLDQSLFVGEALLAGGPHGEVVGKDRHAAAEHHDASALVIRRDEQPSPERALETREHLEELPRTLEVTAIEDQPRRARLAKQPDVRVVDGGALETDHQAFAHEIVEARHPAILVVHALPTVHSLGAEQRWVIGVYACQFGVYNVA